MMEVLVAFFSALLTGLGVGSGGFYLLYLTEVMGLARHEAQGLNLLFFFVASASSVLSHFRRGHLSPSRFLPLLGFGGLGAVFGSLFLNYISPSVTRRIFGVLLLLSGAYTLLSRLSRFGKEKSRGPLRKSLDK